MKIGYITDTHFRDISPINRIDDFYNIQLEKLNNLLNILKKNKIKYLIHGGDFFDSPNVSYRLLYDIINILKKSKIKIYCNIGNHDIYGYNLQTLYRTALGILYKTGLIYMMDDIKNNKDFDCCNIKFIPAAKILDIEKYKNKCDIIVSHDSITDKAVMFDHIRLETIADIAIAKLILCSHIHFPFYKKINNKIFLNPGCLIRQNIIEKDIVPVLSIINLNNYKIENIPIIEKNKLLSSFKIAEINKKQFDFNDFINKIKKINFESKNLEQEFQGFIKSKNINIELKNEILRRLQNELIGIKK